MNVGPSDAAFFCGENIRVSSNAMVVSKPFHLLIYFDCDQVEVEAVANYCLGQEKVKLPGPFIFR